MYSLYTNEVTDCLKPAGISVVFIHQHLKNNANTGVCSIAHPHTVSNAEKIIPKLAKKGLTGIEIIENKKIYKDEEEFQSMGLIKTAGSDFHKAGKNSYLGKNNLSIISDLEYVTQLISMDGMVLAPLRGKYYIVHGKKSVVDDGLKRDKNK